MNAQEIALLAGDIPWSDKVLWRPSAIRGERRGGTKPLRNSFHFRVRDYQ
jgi:hypothetical protein